MPYIRAIGALVFALALLVHPERLDAAVAFGAGDGHWDTSTSVISDAFTVTGSDTVLVVWATCTHASATATGVTWGIGGTPALTKISEWRNGTMYVSLWVLIAPPAGLGSFTVTYSVSVPLKVYGFFVTGAHQTTPIGIADVWTSTATTDPIVSSVPNLTANDMAIGAAASTGGDPDHVAPNDRFFHNSGTPNMQAGDASGTTQVTFNWLSPTTTQMVAIRLRDVGGGAATSRQLLLLGVGP